MIFSAAYVQFKTYVLK